MRLISICTAMFMAGLVLLIPVRHGRAVEPGEGEPGIFKLLHEDESVRIVLATTEPGKTEGWHSHPGYFAYVVQGSKMRYDFPDGTTRDIDIPSEVNRLNDPVVKHRGSNIGTTTFQALLVEFKGRK